MCVQRADFDVRNASQVGWLVVVLSEWPRSAETRLVVNDCRERNVCKSSPSHSQASAVVALVYNIKIACSMLISPYGFMLPTWHPHETSYHHAIPMRRAINPFCTFQLDAVPSYSVVSTKPLKLRSRFKPQVVTNA